MKRKTYKLAWFYRGSYVPKQRLWSWRNNDKLVDGVVVPGAEFVVYRTWRHKRGKL